MVNGHKEIPRAYGRKLAPLSPPQSNLKHTSIRQEHLLCIIGQTQPVGLLQMFDRLDPLQELLPAYALGYGQVAMDTVHVGHQHAVGLEGARAEQLLDKRCQECLEIEF